MIQNQLLLQSQRGAEAQRKEAGTPAAELQNSDVTKVMEDMVRDLRRRVEDLEDIGLNRHSIAPLPFSAALTEVIQRVNYLINIVNEGTSNGKTGYI